MNCEHCRITFFIYSGQLVCKYIVTIGTQSTRESGEKHLPLISCHPLLFMFAVGKKQWDYMPATPLHLFKVVTNVTKDPGEIV